MNMVRGVAESLDGALAASLLEELGREAVRYRFLVAPNPCVGAAVLAGARPIGRGYHQLWGGPHAEPNALTAAADSGVPASEWDSMVMTLEPCSSRGKTGPCVDEILRAGLQCVVVGARDPDPRHRGRGLERLREAGVEVVLLEGIAPLESIAPHFLRWTARERLRRPHPWVIAKWAQTRSGQLSPPADVGEGRWISGPAARAEVQSLRGAVDAVVTGVGTVLADDPRLTVRGTGDATRPPLRVVLDSFLRTPPDARLFAPAGAGEAAGEVHVLAVHGKGPARARALEAAGAHVHRLRPESGERVSIAQAHAWLWERGARRVLLEAGPTLLGAHLEAGLVDQVRIYTGAVNGGRGPSMAEWFGEARLLERLDRECGDDAVLEAFLDSSARR